MQMQTNMIGQLKLVQLITNSPIQITTCANAGPLCQFLDVTVVLQSIFLESISGLKKWDWWQQCMSNPTQAWAALLGLFRSAPAKHPLS